MQKWEYLKVSYEIDGKVPKARLIDDQKVKNWKEGPPMSEHVKQLGEEGWELIGVKKTSMWFKRPKSEQTPGGES